MAIVDGEAITATIPVVAPKKVKRRRFHIDKRTPTINLRKNMSMSTMSSSFMQLLHNGSPELSNVDVVAIGYNHSTQELVFKPLYNYEGDDTRWLGALVHAKDRHIALDRVMKRLKEDFGVKLGGKIEARWDDVRGVMVVDTSKHS